jgi:hypothetical protein
MQSMEGVRLALPTQAAPPFVASGVTFPRKREKDPTERSAHQRDARVFVPRPSGERGDREAVGEGCGVSPCARCAAFTPHPAFGHLLH